MARTRSALHFRYLLVLGLVAATAFDPARPARADADLTGGWDIVLTLVPLGLTVTLPMSVVQSGTSLSVQIGSAVSTGTIDPVGGAFSVSGSTPQCGDFALDGTAAPDGNTTTGTGTIEVAGPPFTCGTSGLVFGATRVACGNGMVDPGESCDDGNRVAGDCCSAFCGIEQCALCPDGSPLDKALLKLGKYDAVAGNDRITAAGEFVSSAAAAFVDPMTRGLEIQVGTPGSPGTFTVAVPPGAYDPVTRQGWTVRRSGIDWKFRSADPALPVTKVRVRLELDDVPRVSVKASGKRRSFATVRPTVPLVLAFVLDPPAATSAACGEIAFGGFAPPPPPSCVLKSNDTMLVCR